ADRLSELARLLAGRSGEKIRISAAVELSRLRDPRALKPLVAALADPSNVVRSVAASGLEHLGDPAALPALRRATKDPDRTVRRRVIDAIAALQHRDDGSSRRRLASVRLAAR